MTVLYLAAILCLCALVLRLFTRQAAAGPIRILPLGDSITAGLGHSQDIPGGYRTRLYDRLDTELFTAANGHDGVDFVGTVDEEADGRSFNPDPTNLPDSEPGSLSLGLAGLFSRRRWRR